MNEQITFNFSRGLELLNEGKSISRIGWNGQGLRITKQNPDENSMITKPYLYLTAPAGSTQQFGETTVSENKISWICSQTDLFAEDWYEVV